MKPHKSQFVRLFAIGVIVMLGRVSAPQAVQARADGGTAVSDAWITTQIFAKYFVDADIKARHLDVETDGGVVTLSGTVYSESEHREAVSKARDTAGVVRVVDKLILQPGKPPLTAAARDRARAEWPKVKSDGRRAADRVGQDISDAWITTKIESKFYLDSDVKGSKLSVATSGGVVTLTGSVGSAAEEQQAIALARNTDGVKDVISRIAVK